MLCDPRYDFTDAIYLCHFEREIRSWEQVVGNDLRFLTAFGMTVLRAFRMTVLGMTASGDL